MDMPERIARMEAQVEGIKEDMTEVKANIKDLHSRITTGQREIIEKIDSMEVKMEERTVANALRSTTQHDAMEANLKADIEKISTRVDVLERWRWMIVGGAIALGYLVSHLELFSKIMPK
jgi:Zn-finger domain-containing protein